jgi:membrane dipeptidase
MGENAADYLFIDGLNASWHVDDTPFQHLVEGRVTAVNATVAANHDASFALNMIGRLLEKIDQRGESALLVERPQDLRRAAETGKVGYIIGLQDTEPLEGRLHLLPIFHRLGVRIVQLTYNFENAVGCGCRSAEDSGLTEVGRGMIRALNRWGILIDLSHCGDRTAWEALEASEHPVAITHANLRTTRDHPRNKPPELVKAVAEAGGVVGAVAFPPLLGESGTGTVGDYLAAIDDLVALVGATHVGLGPDFMEAMPKEIAASVLAGLPDATLGNFHAVKPLEGFASPADFPALAAAMTSHGYADADARLILGENWLRLYERIWTES